MLVKVKVWMFACAHDDAHVTCRFTWPICPDLVYRMSQISETNHVLCPSDTFVPARSSCPVVKILVKTRNQDTSAQPCSKHHWDVRVRICTLTASTTTLGVSR